MMLKRHHLSRKEKKTVTSFPIIAWMGRLGRARLSATAFDAFYVYEYFAPSAEQPPDAPKGFAAIPFSERGGHHLRFDAQGLPLCQADLAMPLRYTFTDKSHLFEYQAGRHVCPLRFPQKTGQTCPKQHKNWTNRRPSSSASSAPGGAMAPPSPT